MAARGGKKANSRQKMNAFATRFRYVEKIKTQNTQFSKILATIKDRNKRYKEEAAAGSSQRNVAFANDSSPWSAGASSATAAAAAAAADAADSRAAEALLFLESEAARNALREATYVDSSRSVAYAHGKDLLTEIKMNRRAKKNLELDMLTGNQWEVILKEGINNMSRGYLLPALRSFDQAIQGETASEEPYIYRSRCHLLLGQPEEALQDSSFALDQIQTQADVFAGVGDAAGAVPGPTPTCTLSEKRKMAVNKIKALHSKAEAYYALSDFEKSLIFFNRCISARPDLRGTFVKGATKATNAILNSVGQSCFKSPFLKEVIDAGQTSKGDDEKERLGRSLVSSGPIKVMDIGSNSRVKGDVAKDSKAIRRPLSSSVGAIGRYRRTFRTANDFALGRLGIDYGFVEELLEEMGIGSTAAAATAMITDEEAAEAVTAAASEAFTFLEQRRDFWKNQDPENHKRYLGKKELRI